MERGEYSERSDVYAFGMVVWELFTRDIPFTNMSPHQAALAVITEDKRPDIPLFVPPKFAQLIQQCWSVWSLNVQSNATASISRGYPGPTPNSHLHDVLSLSFFFFSGISYFRSRDPSKRPSFPQVIEALAVLKKEGLPRIEVSLVHCLHRCSTYLGLILFFMNIAPSLIFFSQMVFCLCVNCHVNFLSCAL